MAEEEGEASPLLNKADGKVDVEAAVEKLEDGLKGWIRVNKTRKARLQQSVDKCEDIAKHTSDFASLMSESRNIQAKQIASITRTNQQLQEQSESLQDLKKVAESIGAKMRDIANTSYWAPPFELFCCIFGCVFVMAVLLVVPYILNSEGIYRLNIRGWFKSQIDQYNQNGPNKNATEELVQVATGYGYGGHPYGYHAAHGYGY
jgi:vacuolar-type H+-ATPase subunit I/STV1